MTHKNGWLVFAIVAAAFGSAFQHGYSLGVVNAPQKVMENWIQIVADQRAEEQNVKPLSPTNSVIWPLAVSVFCVGGLLGSSAVGFVASNVGRKLGILWNNTFVLVAFFFQGCAKYSQSYELFIFGRFLIGVNAGLSAGLVPMYLKEISPAHLREPVGSVYQLGVVVSALISHVLGLEAVLGNPKHWSLLFALMAIPAVLQVAMLPVCPESPKFLLQYDADEAATEQALTMLRGTPDVSAELLAMRAECEASKTEVQVTMRQLCRDAELRRPLTLTLGLMLAQQFSGINAVLFFSTKIFKMARLSETSAQFATLGMGAVNVLATIASFVLVKKASRKTLLLVGFSGMFLDTVLLIVSLRFSDRAPWLSYVCVVLVLVLVALFAVGPGSVPWIMVAELFQKAAKPASKKFAMCVNWAASFVVSISFLPLQTQIGNDAFIVFAILLAASTVFVYLCVPPSPSICRVQRQSPEVVAEQHPEQ